MSDLDFDRQLRVRLGFAIVAAVLGVGIARLTALPEWFAFAVVIVLGIVAPRLYLRYSE